MIRKASFQNFLSITGMHAPPLPPAWGGGSKILEKPLLGGSEICQKCLFWWWLWGRGGGGGGAGSRNFEVKIKIA